MHSRSATGKAITLSFARLFHWQVVRYVAQHRALALLNVLSVALGVAVYFATQTANQSANRAFAASVDLVAGKADLEIRGTAHGVPERAFTAVKRTAGVAAATPLVRGAVSLPDFPGEYLDLLGIDIFTNEPFRTFEIGSDAGQFAPEEWLGQPNVIAISKQFATEHAIRRGDVLRTQVNGAQHRLRVGFLFETNAIADSHFAAIDIGWAQELFGRRDELSSIQLRLARNAKRAEVIERLRKIVPSDATIAPPAQRSEQIDKMLGAFELNLTAMSLVSLLVGMFLIYNSVSASVVRRRHEIGILRSLGTSRNEIRALFLGESALLGLIGSIAGIMGGAVLARILVRVVSGTISSLYVRVSASTVHIAPVTCGVALALGTVSVLAAAWWPARAAAYVKPVAAIPGAVTYNISTLASRRWFWFGAACLCFAAVVCWLTLELGPRWLGFAAAFFVLVGFSFVVPTIAKTFSARAARVLHRTWITRLAAANLGRSLLRNSVTIASLAAAVAMAIGLTVMVFSFRKTVAAWIEETLLADLFIGPASNEIAGPTSFIPRDALAFLETHPAVAAVDTFREVELPFRGNEIVVAVIRGTKQRRLQFLHGDSEVIFRRFHNEQCVLVSEPFARHQHVRDGDALVLRTPAGPQRFVVAGTFYDYTRDRGVVYMSAENFRRLWNDDRVNSAAVYLHDPASAAALTKEFRQRFSNAGEFLIFSNRSLRHRVFQIFDQTFAVTYVLRAIAVIVALVGIFFSLSTLVLERTRELAVMRAVGASANQVRSILLWEAAFVGALAALVGIASGVCLSFVLTGVINRAFFGWTIRLAFPWSSLLLTPTWIIAAAITAALVPAWRAGRVVLAEALRSE